MPHHFTKDTIQAAIFCNACMKETPWRIADGRRQFCLTCYERKQAQPFKTAPESLPEQPRLF